MNDPGGIGACADFLSGWIARMMCSRPNLSHDDWSSLPLGHPFLGKGGQIRSSRHNFLATPPFPNLSTPFERFFWFQRSSPPMDPPKHGQLAFLPTCWPHFQTQPCTTCTYVIKSQSMWENARWGRGVCAFGHSGNVLHPFGRQTVHPQACSNSAAFQNFSCNCMMVRCCEVGLGGGGREGVFRGWPCHDQIRVQTQEMRYLRNTYMLSSQTKSEGCEQSNQI